MKQLKNLLLLTLVIAGAVASCKKNDHPHNGTHTDLNKEYKYVRVAISDETSTKLSLLNPSEETLTSYNARFAKSALYVTESKRFLALIHRENNVVEYFDSGFELHADHVDTKGTPKFASLTGEGLQLPTHFKSKKGEVLTFNDGDATLGMSKEADMHVPGKKMTTINAGLLKHHGAMATFSNGTYAITEKDNSITGSLPEKVKIINNTGTTIHAATIQTKGIHGNATDGTYAVFGSASGILVVKSDGTQKLIKHPESFGTAWFGTILETSSAGKFVGFTAAKGAYIIDVIAESIKPIIENTDIMQCKVSYNNKNLAVLLHSGDLHIYNLATQQLLKSGNVMGATEKTSTQKPQLEATEKFAYITSPSTGQITMVNISDFTKKKSIKTSGDKPYRLSIVGYETDESH